MYTLLCILKGRIGGLKRTPYRGDSPRRGECHATHDSHPVSKSFPGAWGAEAIGDVVGEL